jgi:hypothetical protein
MVQMVKPPCNINLVVMQQEERFASTRIVFPANHENIYIRRALMPNVCKGMASNTYRNAAHNLLAGDDAPFLISERPAGSWHLLRRRR